MAGLPQEERVDLGAGGAFAVFTPSSPPDPWICASCSIRVFKVSVGISVEKCTWELRAEAAGVTGRNDLTRSQGVMVRDMYRYGNPDGRRVCRGRHVKRKDEAPVGICREE